MDQAWRVELLEGRLRKAEGDMAGAIEAYDLAIELVEQTRGRVPSDELRIAFLGKRLSPYEELIRIHMRSGGPRRVDAVFALMERRKARALLDLLRLARIESEADVPSELVRSKLTIEAMLVAARSRLRSLLSMRAGHTGAEESRIRSQIDSLELAYQHVVDQVEQRSRRDAVMLGYGQPIAPEDLQRRILQRGQALIEFGVLEDQIIAVIVTPTDRHAIQLDIESAELNELVAKLRIPVEAVKTGQLSVVQAAWDLEAAEALYQQVFHPLEPYLAGITKLLIVPDGILWQVPFETLVTQRPTMRERSSVLFEDYARVRFLIDRSASHTFRRRLCCDRSSGRHARPGSGSLRWATRLCRQPTARA